MGKVYALHVADPSLIPGTPQDPLSTSTCDSLSTTRYEPKRKKGVELSLIPSTPEKKKEQVCKKQDQRDR